MATWDTYDFDKACEDASWYWLTLGSPYITPNTNKQNTQSVFNQMVDQSCYNAFRKGGIAFAQNWVDCAARRYAAKLSQFGKVSDPAFPSAWMYEIHVKARMWIAINRAQKDMAASVAPEPEPTPSKVTLATQARQITALPGETAARQPAAPSDPFAAIRAAASMAVPITAPAPSSTPSLISRLIATAPAVSPTPIVLAPVPMPGVTTGPSWPTIAPQSDEPLVTKPLDLQTTGGSGVLTGVRELRAWEGVGYYAFKDDESAVMMQLMLMADGMGAFELVSEGTEPTAASIVLKQRAEASASAGAPLAVFLQKAKDAGQAVLVEEGMQSSIIFTRTRDVGVASQRTMANEKAAVVQEPSAGWQKPGDLVIPGMQEVAEAIGEKAKTGLIIGGVVVGVLALGGIAYYFSTRKPARMSPNAGVSRAKRLASAVLAAKRSEKSRRYDSAAHWYQQAGKIAQEMGKVSLAERYYDKSFRLSLK